GKPGMRPRSASAQLFEVYSGCHLVFRGLADAACPPEFILQVRQPLQRQVERLTRGQVLPAVSGLPARFAEAQPVQLAPPRAVEAGGVEVYDPRPLCYETQSVADVATPAAAPAALFAKPGLAKAAKVAVVNLVVLTLIPTSPAGPVLPVVGVVFGGPTPPAVA